MNKMNWSLTRNSVTGTRELSHFIKKRRVKHTDDLANLSHYPLVQRIPHLHPCPYLLCALVIKYQDIKHKCLFIYMNTFWAPHLERSPKHFTMPSIVLLSLRLHSSHMQLWMRDSCFMQRILNIHWGGYSAVQVLHGQCHVKCCRLGASSVYTIQPCTSLQRHFIQSHIG